MTAFDTLEKSLEAHKYGASNYITKPFKSLDIVNDKIKSII
jgi:DNA-binding response OmpR family regulator